MHGFFGGCETRSRDSTTAEKVSVLQNLLLRNGVQIQ